MARLLNDMTWYERLEKLAAQPVAQQRHIEKQLFLDAVHAYGVLRGSTKNDLYEYTLSAAWGTYMQLYQTTTTHAIFRGAIHEPWTLWQKLMGGGNGVYVYTRVPLGTPRQDDHLVHHKDASDIWFSPCVYL